MSQTPELIDGQSSFYMPVDKLKFISVVAKCLERSPRRIFRILVTVQPENSNLRYSGTSIDFSETGMAFECTSDFDLGQKIIVNFVHPRTRRRFILNSVIARRASTQPGFTSFYGVMFSEMLGQDVEELMKFITGED